MRAPMEGTKGFQVLEINLISTQDLKKKANKGSKTQQTYAVVWVDDSSRKLRTRTDDFGDENPTWNDKFLFQVSSEFINSATAGFNVEIYKENAGADLGILLKESSIVNFHELTQPKSQVKVEEEGSTKSSSSSSLLKKLRLVRSSPSLSTMSEPLTTSEVAATMSMRTVKSDSSSLYSMTQ
ncbi:OLC1v1031660C1 [Oldenlandia corymbosa var. corymbosa]|uniref:OLC1v1031660C1 n=1 Tax=Oldenlandia corymbosa var. corymbosa TaxID=529605 RepID=A0AAV1CJC7_OLDCO|nr:OLC1v1031660C1 [Oldenlandia corymbosa var. corymbosa]